MFTLTLLVSTLLVFSTTLAHGRIPISPPLGPIKRAPPTTDNPASANNLARARSQELISQCEERYRDTRLDHFSWANTSTFSQRYYFCDHHYRKGGPILFYLGNEADVVLYLNNTGLMWELGPKLEALIVFAEHRYYGKSKPFKDEVLRNNMQWLTTEQAMADYATLIWQLKQELNDPTVPVIGFGGSYGGMLAAWFRMKFPHLLDGAIAASAPIWTYLGEDPAYDPGSFAEVVTRDAGPEAGSAPACADNVRAAWQTMFDWGESSEGRSALASAMSLCPDSTPSSPEEVMELAQWAQGAWDYLAMGDYPYPSSYMTNGDGELPAFPVRAACEYLSGDNTSTRTYTTSTNSNKDTIDALNKSRMHGEELLNGMAKAVGIFYNATGSAECFNWNEGANNATDEVADFWDFQFCTEQFMPFSRDGKRDMFWSQPFNQTETITACLNHWNVHPRPLWATIEWGGKRIASTASNIVFSNGLLDPWSAGGVMETLSDSVVAVIIPEGAHHLDLFFSHPDDPESVKEARKIEEEHIRRWVKEAREERSSARGAGVKRKKVEEAVVLLEAHSVQVGDGGLYHRRDGTQTYAAVTSVA